MANKTKINRLSRQRRRYLELAKRIARQSTHGTHSHGCVLVKGGSVINASANKNNYCTFGRRFSVYERKDFSTLHAELGAVLGLDQSQTSGSIAYVVRVKGDEWRMSKPCPMCEQALRFCGVKKVVYTTNDNSVIVEKL
jgi:tRNA(Arg) A34 adenosine deaminase TadA